MVVGKQRAGLHAPSTHWCGLKGKVETIVKYVTGESCSCSFNEKSIGADGL